MTRLALPDLALELEHLYRTDAVGLCLFDEKWRFVRINQELADMNGFPVADHIGVRPWELIPEIHVAEESFCRSVEQRTEPLLHIEVRGTTPADPGVERHWLVSMYPMHDDAGFIGCTSIVLEITEQRRAEEALQAVVDDLESRVRERTEELNEANRRLLQELGERERAEQALLASKLRLRQLLESTHAVPWEADAATWRFTYVGPQIEQLFGYPVQRWYESEHFWANVIHPDDRERAVRNYHELSRTNPQYQFEFRALTASGQEVWIQDLVTVHVVDGEPRALRGFMIDITKRKRAEAELRRSEAQARLHREELAHVTRVATMGELAASLAHELNQPLTAVVANAQAARRWGGQETPNMSELLVVLDDIIADGKRAGEVIRRMRNLVSKTEPLREPLSVNRLVSQVLRLVHQDAIERRVRIVEALPESLPSINGDEIQLQQVILNLVLNGFDAMADVDARDRVLTLGACSSDGEAVTITVSDQGCGVPTEFAERIFEPFFSSKPEGMGMGLSINRSIVQAHGGSLWATNGEACGSTFHVRLPACDGPGE